MKRLVTFFTFVLLMASSGIAQTSANYPPKAKLKPGMALDQPVKIRPDQLVNIDGKWTPDNKPAPTPKATTTPEESQEIVATVVEAPTPVDEGGPSATVILIILAVLLVLGGRYVYLIVFRGHEVEEGQNTKPIPASPPHIRGNY